MKFLGKVKVVVFLALLVILLLCSSDAWRRRRRRRSPPVRRPLPRSPTGLPYCPLDARVKNIIDQKRFGREIQEFKRGTTWPYNCLHASILEHGGKFNIIPLIFSCCNSCSFPFSTCISKYGTTPSWRCPSQGMQCIVKCVRKHDPYTATSRRRKFFGKRVKPTIRISNSKCERKVKKGGKYCVERLCIPIQLT